MTTLLLPCHISAACLKPKDPGPCKDSKLRFYYDSSLKGCAAFYYGGCEGNSNRFQTGKDCTHTCYKTNATKSPEVQKSKKTPTDAKEVSGKGNDTHTTSPKEKKTNRTRSTGAVKMFKGADWLSQTNFVLCSMKTL